MTNSLWVTLHILQKAVSSHLFPCPTASEQCCKFCERLPHCILPYYQQLVRNSIAHFVKGSLITLFPMTNRLWVILHFLWKPTVLSHLFQWPTASESHCTFSDLQSQHTSIHESLIYHYIPCISESEHTVAISTLLSLPHVIIPLTYITAFQVSVAGSWRTDFFHISLHVTTSL